MTLQWQNLCSKNALYPPGGGGGDGGGREGVLHYIDYTGMCGAEIGYTF